MTDKLHSFPQRRDIWLRWITESNLSLVARVIGTHLALRMNAKKPYCWPNIKTMAKVLEISARHSQRGMLELEQFGALKVIRTVGKGNYYALRLPTDPDD